MADAGEGVFEFLTADGGSNQTSPTMRDAMGCSVPVRPRFVRRSIIGTWSFAATGTADAKHPNLAKLHVHPCHYGAVVHPPPSGVAALIGFDYTVTPVALSYGTWTWSW